MTNLQEGMEIVIGSIGQYCHHGVVTKVCRERSTYEIVHLTDDTGFKGVSDCQKMNIAFDEYMLHYCEYDKSINDRQLVKLRAEILYEILNDIDYDFSKFNCEHFATYCSEGFAYSRQLNYYNEAATNTLDSKCVLVYLCYC